MTRDEFAAAAIPALIALEARQAPTSTLRCDRIAFQAYVIADAALRARELSTKTPDGKAFYDIGV